LGFSFVKDEQIEEVIRQLCLEVGPKQFLQEIIKMDKWFHLMFFFPFLLNNMNLGTGR